MTPVMTSVKLNQVPHSVLLKVNQCPYCEMRISNTALFVLVTASTLEAAFVTEAKIKTQSIWTFYLRIGFCSSAVIIIRRILKVAIIPAGTVVILILLIVLTVVSSVTNNDAQLLQFC